LAVLAVLLALALLFSGCERKITGDTEEPIDGSILGCLECHTDGSGPNQGILAQFGYSVHGSGDNTYRNRLYSSRYASCERCHTSEGFIALVTGIPADGDHFTAFDCFTCHEPHSNGDFRVRITAPVALEDGTVYDRANSNTCATCHHSRRDVNEYVVDGVELSSHWGPHHSNQADMLIGANAYEYTGFDYSGSWHETGVTRGCPSCHMSASVHESVGGHSWNMKNEDLGLENITGCNVDGCHSANPVASVDRETVNDFDGDGVVEGVQTEIHNLLDSLGVLLVQAGLIDNEHHPVEDLVIGTADSAGALYNFLFVEEDRSVGVHNTAYAVALLQSSINFLTTGSPSGVATRPGITDSHAMWGNKAQMLPSH
jgi:hypothetical protein